MAITVLRTQHARDDSEQNIQYLHRGITVDGTPSIVTTPGKIVYVGVLPAYSLKMETIVRVNTSFDGEMVIGTSANTAAFGNTSDIIAGATDTYIVDTGYGARSTADVPVYVNLTTGTTQGGADIWISYLKGNSAGSTA